MAWSLYYLNKHKLKCTDQVANEILISEDCIALLCLFQQDKYRYQVIDFAKTLLDKSTYEQDQYWLLLYQLFKEGCIQEPYDDGVFELLNKYEVDFMSDAESNTKAERYCDHINNPFRIFIKEPSYTFETCIEKELEKDKIDPAPF